MVPPLSWTEAVGLFIAVLEDGTEEGKAKARAELERMAELADRYVDLSK